MKKYTWDYLCEGAEFFHLDRHKFNEFEKFFHLLDHEIFAAAAEKTLTEDIEPFLDKNFSEDEKFKLRLLLASANFETIISLYRSKSYPGYMLDEISHDLALWMEKMESDFGHWGLTERIFDWIKCQITGEVKQFGRLQCNDIHFFEPHCTFTADGNSVSHGDPCINLHIPAAGPLEIADCLKSLQAMVDFSHKFNPDFDYKAIVCYSWLLDAQFKKLLPASSNIIKFQGLGHNFTLHEVNQDQEVLWRLWDEKTAQKPLSEIICKTSLQKNVIKFLQNGGHFYEGCLVIFRDELKNLLKK